ncbi:hypothetical protein, partial [Rhodococcus aetherivorans]|uniref:hypothetical protein n=1 Tax=Rhodococcus aetherivorans TaxID=191292 RepID=UPI0012DDC5CD
MRGPEQVVGDALAVDTGGDGTGDETADLPVQRGGVFDGELHRELVIRRAGISGNRLTTAERARIVLVQGQVTLLERGGRCLLY